MKTLRKLTCPLALMLVLGLPAFAGEQSTPPCPAPEPGELTTPPCQGISLGDMGDPSSLSTATAEEAFTEIATIALESMLLIF